MHFIEGTLIVFGASFMLLSAIGLFRLPRFFHRVHALTKASTIGLMFLILALMVSEKSLLISLKGMLGMLFITMTMPTGAHLLARSAKRRGEKP